MQPLELPAWYADMAEERHSLQRLQQRSDNVTGLGWGVLTLAVASQNFKVCSHWLYGMKYQTRQPGVQTGGAWDCHYVLLWCCRFQGWSSIIITWDACFGCLLHRFSAFCDATALLSGCASGVAQCA
jgi:hypothetical protein